MNLTKKSIVFFIILAFAAGYGGHYLVEGLGIERNQTEGDVSKANRYNRHKDHGQLDLLQKRLQSDNGYYNKTREVSSFLLSRVNSLADLTERSIEQCSGIEELKGQVSGLQSLNAKANNTKLALESICSGLTKMAAGKDVPDYEQAYNNAVTGFFRIEGQMELGKSFVESAAQYLEGKENAALAGLMSEWAVFSYQDAALTKSESEMTYWNGKCNDLAGKAAGIEGFDPELLSSLDVTLAGMDEFVPSSFLDMLQILNLDYDGQYQGLIPPQPKPPVHDSMPRY